MNKILLLRILTVTQALNIAFSNSPNYNHNNNGLKWWEIAKLIGQYSESYFLDKLLAEMLFAGEEDGDCGLLFCKLKLTRGSDVLRPDLLEGDRDVRLRLRLIVGFFSISRDTAGVTVGSAASDGGEGFIFTPILSVRGPSKLFLEATSVPSFGTT